MTEIRERCAGDLPGCVRLLETLHRSDAYPLHWPKDPARWLSPAGALAAWVAESGGAIAGHVALRAVTAETGGAAIWSDATGLPPARLAAVTRLFVFPASRGAGLGSALLEAACSGAAARGLHPVLDVTDEDVDAIRLYERRGWRRVHSEPWAPAPDGETLLHYYVAPSTTSSRAATPAP